LAQGNAGRTIGDPFVHPGQSGGKIDLRVIQSSRTGWDGVIHNLAGLITGVNRFHAYEEFDTDFQVSTGKIAIVFAMTYITSAVAKAIGLQYVDTAVGDSATSGTNQNTVMSSSLYKAAAADVLNDAPNYYGEIPAGKYIQMSTTADSATITSSVMMIEVDA